MPRFRLPLLVLAAAAACAPGREAADAAAKATDAAVPAVVPARDYGLPGWQPPSLDSIRDDSLGASVRRGLALLRHTKDSLPRYATSSLNCTSCHLEDGLRIEAAPLTGLYASGRTGWYEHNLYPVRYNKAAWEVTKRATGSGIIWGRSAWAGSQRYGVHWGGDAENTNSAMAATLRGGLSLGLSGFTYWSHDIGGFVNRAPRDLYRRWTPFGALSSHTRTHGAPPRRNFDRKRDGGGTTPRPARRHRAAAAGCAEPSTSGP